MKLKAKFARRSIAVAAMAVAISLCAAAGTAYAYYTDTSKANGMLTFSYEATPSTDIEEWKDGTDKIIMVQNTGTALAMVRVKVFAPDVEGLITGIENTSVPEGSSVTSGITPDKVSERGTWVEHGGWWYFTAPLNYQELTKALRITIDTSNISYAFDVAVVQQAANVLVSDDGVYYGDFPELFVPEGDAAVTAPKDGDR